MRDAAYSSCALSSFERLMRRDFRKVRSFWVKGPSPSSVGSGFENFFGLAGFRLDLVESDGGLQHEENIETLLADVFDDAGNILRLRDGLVDRFAKLLDQVFDLLVQCHLRTALCMQPTTHRVFPA